MLCGFRLIDNQRRVKQTESDHKRLNFWIEKKQEEEDENKCQHINNVHKDNHPLKTNLKKDERHSILPGDKQLPLIQVTSSGLMLY